MLRLALLLAAVAAPAAVPTPESHFGHPMGADRTVLDWDKVVSYFQALERNSDRIHVEVLGRSTEGRPFLAAVIAAPAVLRQLDRYRWIQKKLADPRITSEAEAERLIAEGKAVVMITCSIHATEIASTHTAVEFAWRLLSEDRPKYRAILDNVIFLLVPSLNPDGLDLVTRWYRKTLGTPFEGTSPPQLYHKYVGHDNNRDWYFFTQAETRLTVQKLHNVWHPQIVYDVHQMGPSGPRMFVPPWMDPIDPNIDPLIVQQCNAYGMGMALDLTAAGKKGVIVNAMYDFWSPSRHYQAYHGGLRILSESASVRIASPLVGSTASGGAAERAEASRAAAPTMMSWNYVEPWTGGDWRLRDIVDYQLVAFESILYQAALRRQDLLRNFYRIGQRACARAAPWAFLVPVEQQDPGAARKMLETLAFGLVEIERAEREIQSGGRRFPAGSYLIRMAQPYSGFAKTLLERQRYPDLRQYPGGPPKRPYDVTAHTLPLLLGVEVVELPAAVAVPRVRASEFVFRRAGSQPPPGALPAADIESWRAVNRAWNSAGQLWRDPRTGDFFRAPAPGLRELPRPRIALYKSYVPAMDEGWTRWVLDEFGFAYRSLENPQVLAGGLEQNFDVVIFPDQSPAVLADGYRAGAMPPEYTGGLGSRGAEVLRAFAQAGGTLVFLNHSCGWAVEQLGLALKNVVAGVPVQQFYSPGSLLEVGLDANHPLSLGLPPRIAIWSEGSPAWEVPAGSPARVVARYPDSQVLASGWLLGEKYLTGRAALVEYPLGRGRVVLFGFRPQYRGQSWQAFKLLFNAFLLPRS